MYEPAKGLFKDAITSAKGYSGYVQGLRGGARLPHPIRWWRYCHDSRLALLGTGEQGLWLQVCSHGLACFCAYPC